MQRILDEVKPWDAVRGLSGPQQFDHFQNIRKAEEAFRRLMGE